MFAYSSSIKLKPKTSAELSNFASTMPQEQSRRTINTNAAIKVSLH